ncbi:hypothetical protein ACFV2N_17220 [Streptomyces sp. NPDC059680]|uniref:hypothetical protein n=1 Tax=Streptomyces sp. NPDC059680 TaxID=3346904 RepID=UPI003694F614
MTLRHITGAYAAGTPRQVPPSPRISGDGLETGHSKWAHRLNGECIGQKDRPVPTGLYQIARGRPVGCRGGQAGTDEVRHRHDPA